MKSSIMKSSVSAAQQPLLFFFCALTVTHLGSCVGGSAATAATPVLSKATSIRIERSLVSKEAAQELYLDILETAVPGPRDNFHNSLLGFKGDAGIQVEQGVLTSVERATKFRELIGTDSAKHESGILRIEHLKRNDYDRAKELIHKVVENSVLEDEGTIHLYLSRPNSAALANHTDPTDIFVLQLRGTKEWLLCEDEESFHEKSLRNKLNKCATYNEIEISDLVCHREKLFPGDALYLPKRIVHSARATHEGLTAHLTFGFADDMCSKDDSSELFLSSRKVEETPRVLQSTCDAADGGIECDHSCDGSCFSCDTDCNGSCDANCFGGCVSGCDSNCDGDCDSCDSSCDSSCNVCPGGAGGGSLSAGAKAGISIAVLLAVFGGIFLIYRYQKIRGRESSKSKATPDKKETDGQVSTVAKAAAFLGLSQATGHEVAEASPHKDGTKKATDLAKNGKGHTKSTSVNEVEDAKVVSTDVLFCSDQCLVS